MALNYLKWLRTQKQVICCEKDPTTATYQLESLTMFGYKIEIINEWDRIIKALPELNNGTKYDNPHRAYIMSSDDYAIGTCESGNFDGAPEFKVETYNNKFKFVPEYTINIQLLVEDKFVLAI